MKKPDVLEHDQKVDSDERPFLDHLLELRRRILNAVLTILVLFFPLYYFANEIYTWVAAPLLANLPSGSNMIATEVASPCNPFGVQSRL
jgi:sec-independent protein translocase protein TatC